jgi:hypothetical protein
MDKKCKIMVCKCLVEKLELDDSTEHIYKSNLLSILFHIA